MENKALKQRLESLAQEQLIKYCKFLQYDYPCLFSSNGSLFFLEMSIWVFNLVSMFEYLG
jgi:hypothetical protein